jgi:hypothetical protein
MHREPIHDHQYYLLVQHTHTHTHTE